MKKNKRKRATVGAIILFFISATATAAPKIAILDFELKDLTLLPGIPAEINRTASIKPLLEQELSRAGYVIINIDANSQQYAQSGVGYLYDHSDTAAALARQFNADYVLVGKLHKPSFLFAYLMGHLIRVSDAKLIGNYITEAKGPSAKLTAKTVARLALKIDKTLGNYSASTK